MQLSRRNLSGEKYKYYVGKQLEAEKAARGGDRKSTQAKSKRQNDALIQEGDTAERIAKSNLQSEDLKKDNRTVTRIAKEHENRSGNLFRTCG